MQKKRVLYPERIYLVDHSRIQDGTVNTIATLKADANVFLVPRRGEEGVTFSRSGEALNIRERAENGKMVTVDQLDTEAGQTFSINLGRWSFEIEALKRGRLAGDVEEDHKASIDASEDATVKGIKLEQTLEQSKMAALFQMPVDKQTGETLYFYVPKCQRNVADAEQTINVEQQSNVLNMICLALEESDPDEVTPHQAIYDNVNAYDLGFWFEGSIDAV